MRASVIGPELADAPDDGGRWALYCEHIDDTGEVIGVGLLQDTNKRRLSEWRTHSREWCPYCQEEAHT